MVLELRVCEYPTYARGFVVVSGKVKETAAGEACDEDGCCARMLLEPETGEPVVASYTVVASADGSTQSSRSTGTAKTRGSGCVSRSMKRL